MVKGILCAAAMLAANIAISVQLVRCRNLHFLLQRLRTGLEEGYRERRLKSEVKKYLKPVSIDLNIIEKLELHYIDKSNIRHYIPFINFYTLIFITAVLFVLLFKPVYRVFNFVPSALVICALLSLGPLLVLDLMARYNSEKVRSRLAEFISVLNRWCAVKADIFYAFYKTSESGLGEPLNTFIRDMVVQVNRGLEPAEALEILQLKVDNPQFRDFIINIRQNLKHRGDIRKLLSNLEEQFYKIEEEYSRRRISTYKDRLVIYAVMLAVLVTAYSFMKINPQVESYYFGTIEGKLLLMVFCLLYAFGLYITLGITKFKN